MLLEDGNILYYVRGMELKGKGKTSALMDMTYIHQDSIPKTVRLNFTFRLKNHGGIPDSIKVERAENKITRDIKNETYYVDNLDNRIVSRVSFVLPLDTFKEQLLFSDLSFQAYYGSINFRFKHKRRDRKYYSYILEEFNTEFGWDVNNE